ncbi:hypothetical protein [Dactylosporangium sp. CA-092794]|uniref:hypothetical protein n=1 Tax=Dactylosporangium sp. CA-092794 TaxID=3239929 RepID=UPI003D93D483
MRQLLRLVVLCATLTACTGAPNPPRPVPSPTFVAAGECPHPAATATTGQSGIGVGSPDAPAIGPLTFHPYSYQPGFVTKMIIYAVRDQPRAVALTGRRCTDGRPLRFWYGRNDLPPAPPLSEQRLQSLGDLTQELPPVAAGVAHTGYVLFSGAGQWAIAVEEGDLTLGVLLVTVRPG